MTYLTAEIPELEILKQRLEQEDWVNYYLKFDSFRGDAEGIVYLIGFMKKRIPITVGMLST